MVPCDEHGETPGATSRTTNLISTPSAARACVHTGPTALWMSTGTGQGSELSR